MSQDGAVSADPNQPYKVNDDIITDTSLAGLANQPGEGASSVGDEVFLSPEEEEAHDNRLVKDYNREFDSPMHQAAKQAVREDISGGLRHGEPIPRTNAEAEEQKEPDQAEDAIELTAEAEDRTLSQDTDHPPAMPGGGRAKKR